MRKFRVWMAITAIVVLAGIAAHAQQAEPPTLPPAQATAPIPGTGQQGLYSRGNRGPKSPEVAPDGTVTFRLLAPQAGTVAVTGTWLPPGATPVPLVRNDAGLWTVTIGPLKSEYYSYNFVLDGVTILDPANANVQRDVTRYLNILDVPGPVSALYEVSNVPHGTVQQVWYPAPTLNMAERRMYVYAPAGYEGGTERYPVLYLLHGAGGDEDAWDSMGRAREIFDNVIASGKAKPMIVVMANGSWNQSAAPGVTVQAVQVPGAGGFGNSLKFSDSIVMDEIPFVDNSYRTIADRDHRAIAGLSMGGAQTLVAGLNHLDKFSYVASFSGALVLWPGAMKRVSVPAGSRLQGPGVGQELNMDAVDKTFPSLDASANAKLHLLYIACGLDDGLVVANQQFMDWLTSKGVVYKKVLLPDYAHVWPFWRLSLADLMPQLFVSTPGSTASRTNGGL